MWILPCGNKLVFCLSRQALDLICVGYRYCSSVEGMAKRTQPAWTSPEGTAQPQLCLYNSLTRTKERFVPQNGNKVLWYSCGPTVYDASHMGHARSYISFDILRRVLSDYFHYDVLYVMNITDIDDKIIKRARQNYLFESYCKQNHNLDKIVDDCLDSKQVLLDKLNNETDPDKKQLYERTANSVAQAIDSVRVSGANRKEQLLVAKENLLEICKDAISERLDRLEGNTVSDNEIFTSLPRHWEEEFHKDMAALNVLSADVLTRVSDYIPEIIDFVKRIIDKGYGYESGGSVYFDTLRFDSADAHHYAKLVPEAFGDSSALQEGEGDLSRGEDRLKEKRSQNDFALWKTSKPGEPAWDSPWGKGRPGWHIECSVMASAICGSSMDIHCGGYDLKFPHHDNEIAQSEAYFDNDNWVRYFLHSGHLTISGCKMSKSLKNFVTIKDALQRNTWRQLRFAFLLHAWKDTLDYSDATMEIALGFEKLINEFFLNVKELTRGENASSPSFYQKWAGAEIDLQNRLGEAQAKVHEALCDNIDTRQALNEIRELISACNQYILRKKQAKAVTSATETESVLNRLLIKNAALYVMDILRVFGVVERDQSVGFRVAGESQATNLEEVVMPYLSVLAEFREQIRQIGRQEKVTDILRLCDELRDNVLPDLGVRLEDHDTGAAIKLVDKETLRKEKELKLRLEAQKRDEKERKKREAAEAQAAREAAKGIPPTELFRREAYKYSKFDEKGMPTHDHEGKELSKGLLKKLQKIYQTQEKTYAEYCNSTQQEASQVNGHS